VVVGAGVPAPASSGGDSPKRRWSNKLFRYHGPGTAAGDAAYVGAAPFPIFGAGQRPHYLGLSVGAVGLVVAKGAVGLSQRLPEVC
jgi:hypothetical protein